MVGHTYGPTDRCFGTIEKYLSQVENVYTPSEWYKHVKDSNLTTNTGVEVIEMKQEYFRNHRDHLRQMYTERSKGEDGKPLEFSKDMWFNFDFGIGEECVDGVKKRVEHPKVVWYGYTHDVYETPRVVSFYQKSHVSIQVQNVPPMLYDHYPLPIKAAKHHIRLPTVEETLERDNSESD